MPRRHDAEGEQTVASNRRARHDYQLIERFETGIQLTGDEVKSLKQGRGSLTDTYARVRSGEVWLEGMHVPPYEQGDKRRHEALRPRKLLLHRRQIEHVDSEVREKGLTLVPLRVYVAHGMLKVEIALARGKREYEKRQSIAKRDAQREVERELGRRR
jgi:SsrA-binding protein